MWKLLGAPGAPRRFAALKDHYLLLLFLPELPELPDEAFEPLPDDCFAPLGAVEAEPLYLLPPLPELPELLELPDEALAP